MFIDQRFPEYLAYDGIFGPSWSTDVALMQSGWSQRNQNWHEARCRFEITFQNRSQAEAREFTAWVYHTAGAANTFRFHDPTDDTGTNEGLGVGDGVQTIFPLIKHYYLGALDYHRPIVLPVEGTVSVTLNDVATGAFTVQAPPGQVTLTTPPAAGVVVRASFTFDVVARFERDYMPLSPTGPHTYTIDGIVILEEREAE